MHDAACLLRVVLADPDEGGVVEAAVAGQVVVLDVGDEHLEERQEDPLGRLAEVVVLLRRQADERRGKDRVAPMRDRGHLDDGVSIGQRVEAGVVAEGAFEDGARTEFAVAAWIEADRPALGRDVPLDHDLAVRGHAKRHGLAAHERDPAAVEVARHQQLAQSRRQRRGRGVGHHALAAQGDRDRHRLAELLPAPPVVRTVVMHVPVHRKPRGVDELRPVHADVVARGARIVAIVGVDRVHPAEGEVAARARGGAGVLRRDAEADRGRIAVERPALDERKPSKVDLALRGELDDLLADAAATSLRSDAQKRQELPGLRERFAERAGRLRLGERADLRADRLEAAAVGAAESDLHPAIAAEEVHREREVAAVDVLEEDRPPAEIGMARIESPSRVAGPRARALRHPIDHLARLEDRRDRLAHADEFAGGVEGIDEFAKGREHRWAFHRKVAGRA